MPRVCILETGGTIGGVGPLLERLGPIEAEVELRRPLNKESNNITPKDWVRIAREVVRACKDDFEGVVVTHGTATLSYTAAALSFTIRDLPVPVVVTGSMIPGDARKTDALSNLHNAVAMASGADLAGVCVVFSRYESSSDGVVIRGTRSRKVSSTRLNAFQSINTSPIGFVTGGRPILTDGQVMRRRAPSEPYLQPDLETAVSLITFHPGLTAKAIEQMLTQSSGAVIEAYGSGQIRTDDPQILDILAAFQGPLALASQCHDGGVDLHPELFEADRIAMTLKNLIPVRDMLPEVALVKLMWILGNEWDPKEFLTKNVCGEIG